MEIHAAAGRVRYPPRLDGGSSGIYGSSQSRNPRKHGLGFYLISFRGYRDSDWST